MKTLKTPVLLITFKRLDTTLKVLESIRHVKPEKLYISSNAADPAKPEEVEKVSLVRSRIEKMIDWQCEVKKLYRTEHVSAKNSIWSAICWLFENEEEGIILEDDTLPDPSFFYYSEELLEKFRNDKDVRFINGCNFNYKGLRNSYGYTRFMNMWGWATWRRSIEMVDQTMSEWKKMPDKKGFLEEIFKKQNPKARSLAVNYFLKIFNQTEEGKIDTWDYQCIFSNLLTQTYAIFPQSNMVTNLGFGSDGTNTNFESYFLSAMKLEKTTLPLLGPNGKANDEKYQEFSLERLFGLKFRGRLYYSFKHRIFFAKKRLGLLKRWV